MNIRPGDLRFLLVVGATLAIIVVVLVLNSMAQRIADSYVCRDGEVLVKVWTSGDPVCVAARTPGRRTTP